MWSTAFQQLSAPVTDTDGREGRRTVMDKTNRADLTRRDLPRQHAAGTPNPPVGQFEPDAGPRRR